LNQTRKNFYFLLQKIELANISWPSICKSPITN